MKTTPSTSAQGPDARRIADLLDENAECYSENAMDRAFLGNSEELAALVVEYLALTASPPPAASPAAPSGVIIHAIASLAAAISLLERTPKAKKAAPSDRMFEQMLCDYRKALDEARAVLTPAPAHANAETIAELHERIRNLMQTLEESAAAEGRWQHQAQSFQRLYEECQVAMENAGYLGSVPDCIKELCARAERASLASDATPAPTSRVEQDLRARIDELVKERDFLTAALSSSAGPAVGAVAKVVHYDPRLDPDAMKPRRIIDGTARFMSGAALGTALYAHPAPATVEMDFNKLARRMQRLGAPGTEEELEAALRAALAPATEGRKG